MNVKNILLAVGLLGGAALISVPLVRGPVENDLQVRVQETLDAAIPEGTFDDVNADVDHLDVALSGSVASEADRDAATPLVQAVPGVGRVTNDLEVSFFDDQVPDVPVVEPSEEQGGEPNPSATQGELDNPFLADEVQPIDLPDAIVNAPVDPIFFGDDPETQFGTVATPTPDSAALVDDPSASGESPVNGTQPSLQFSKLNSKNVVLSGKLPDANTKTTIMDGLWVTAQSNDDTLVVDTAVGSVDWADGVSELIHAFAADSVSGGFAIEGSTLSVQATATESQTAAIVYERASALILASSLSSEPDGIAVDVRPEDDVPDPPQLADVAKATEDEQADRIAQQLQRDLIQEQAEAARREREQLREAHRLEIIAQREEQARLEAARQEEVRTEQAVDAARVEQERMAEAKRQADLLAQQQEAQLAEEAAGEAAAEQTRVAEAAQARAAEELRLAEERRQQEAEEARLAEERLAEERRQQALLTQQQEQARLEDVARQAASEPPTSEQQLAEQQPTKQPSLQAEVDALPDVDPPTSVAPNVPPGEPSVELQTAKDSIKKSVHEPPSPSDLPWDQEGVDDSLDISPPMDNDMGSFSAETPLIDVPNPTPSPTLVDRTQPWPPSVPPRTSSFTPAPYSSPLASSASRPVTSSARCCGATASPTPPTSSGRTRSSRRTITPLRKPSKKSAN